MRQGNKYLLVLLMVVLVACFSYWYSGFPGMSDFVVFYGVTQVILDPNIPVVQVYNPDVLRLAIQGIPTENLTLAYKYSIFAAYLMAPIGFLSYRGAEALLIFLNVFGYTMSVYMILKSCGANNRWLFYPLALSILWIPFIKNIQFGQINAMLLFFMTIAIVFARNNRYVLCGVVLAVATLFKPFFLAVTMVLFIKNWRILLGYLPVLFIALMLPGTSLWLQSFFWPPHPFYCYSALYNYLGHIDNYLFYVYAVGIGVITAWITYRNRHLDFFAIASFGIVGSFLAMPVLEANHLTILIFSFICFLFQRPNLKEKALVGISYLLINLGSLSIYGGESIFAGLIMMWLVLAYKLGKQDGKNEMEYSTV